MVKLKGFLLNTYLQLKVLQTLSLKQMALEYPISSFQ